MPGNCLDPAHVRIGCELLFRSQAERKHWRAYMQAYEDMIRHTATEHAPWYVVPADNKWFTRMLVAAALIETLDSLGLRYPKVGRHQLKELAAARRALA